MAQSSEYGLVSRVYAKNTEGVHEAVMRVTETVRQAHAVGLGQVEVVVPLIEDCGQTFPQVHEALAASNHARACGFTGDPNAGALTAGIRILQNLRCKYGFVISNKAIRFLTKPNVLHMLEAFERGALVVGMPVDELAESVRQGLILNTFAAWDINALAEVGFFDSKDGVEEIAPIGRWIQKYHRPCIAVVEPENSADIELRSGPEAEEHHRRVLATKRERQEAEARRVGVTLESFAGYVIKD